MTSRHSTVTEQSRSPLGPRQHELRERRLANGRVFVEGVENEGSHASGGVADERVPGTRPPGQPRGHPLALGRGPRASTRKRPSFRGRGIARERREVPRRPPRTTGEIHAQGARGRFARPPRTSRGRRRAGGITNGSILWASCAHDPGFERLDSSGRLKNPVPLLPP